MKEMPRVYGNMKNCPSRYVPTIYIKYLTIYICRYIIQGPFIIGIIVVSTDSNILMSSVKWRTHSEKRAAERRMNMFGCMNISVHMWIRISNLKCGLPNEKKKKSKIIYTLIQGYTTTKFQKSKRHEQTHKTICKILKLKVKTFWHHFVRSLVQIQLHQQRLTLTD